MKKIAIVFFIIFLLNCITLASEINKWYSPPDKSEPYGAVNIDAGILPLDDFCIEKIDGEIVVEYRNKFEAFLLPATCFLALFYMRPRTCFSDIRVTPDTHCLGFSMVDDVLCVDVAEGERVIIEAGERTVGYVSGGVDLIEIYYQVIRHERIKNYWENKNKRK